MEGTEPVRLDTKVPAAPADEVAAEPVPRDPAADAKRAAAAEAAALAAEKSSQAKAHAEAVAAEALEQQVEADSDLASARREVKEAKAAADPGAQGCARSRCRGDGCAEEGCWFRCGCWCGRGRRCRWRLCWCGRRRRRRCCQGVF